MHNPRGRGRDQTSTGDSKSPERSAVVIREAIGEGGKPVVYVLEVNPRASRTVPFVAKATGLPVAKVAAKVMAGKKLKELGFTKEIQPKHWCVKTSNPACWRTAAARCATRRARSCRASTRSGVRRRRACGA